MSKFKANICGSFRLLLGLLVVANSTTATVATPTATRGGRQRSYGSGVGEREKGLIKILPPDSYSNPCLFSQSLGVLQDLPTSWEMLRNYLAQDCQKGASLVSAKRCATATCAETSGLVLCFSRRYARKPSSFTPRKNHLVSQCTGMHNIAEYFIYSKFTYSHVVHTASPSLYCHHIPWRARIPRAFSCSAIGLEFFSLPVPIREPHIASSNGLSKHSKRSSPNGTSFFSAK